MNFFGGANYGETTKDMENTDFINDNQEIEEDIHIASDHSYLIFLILLMQNCGCGFMKGGINIDCGTILLLLLLSNCGCGGH